MYAWLLVLHILAAVAVIGSAFLAPIVRRSARTAAQLRFVFDATATVALLSKLGAAVLVLTGIWLMIIADTGFSQMWLNLSILLSLILAATIGGFIEPRVKRLKRIASESQGHGLSADVGLAMRKLVLWETTAQLLALAVTVLMVVKPALNA
ncbi:DUF2269 family protein [Cohnella rhizosphaerae]|uniref:DUF2269 domain-containing protein n=1 Tax=Cohnella rhizosphaerae TaxID=1457232 RepID=A0A9X4QTJ3_9BACL|nr:DUF2269 family protein [Cohnella rhizosphaerae]MDG0811256.1 DUF2269 domain-containing protein [Cohnella rhizosphaerae]